MTKALSLEDLVVGSEISGVTRAMTRERIQWCDDGLESAVQGKFTRVGANIHTDDDFARAQGLPAIIADGMISTNWLSAMLVKQFGIDYLERGRLRTKYIKPIFEDVVVSTRGRVRSIERLDDGNVRYSLDVWCEDQEGTKLTDGEAQVEVVAHR